MSGNPIFRANPLLGQWLSAANSAAQAWRGFWTAEFARQQAAMVTEWNRQATQFWTGAWAAPLMAAAAKPETATRVVPAPKLADMAEPLPLPSAPAAEPASVASTLTEESPKPVAKPRKGAVQLRTATEARKAKAPRRSSAKRGHITRH